VRLRERAVDGRGRLAVDAALERLRAGVERAPLLREPLLFFWFVAIRASLGTGTALVLPRFSTP
jgi:hypothetical protein